MVPAFLYSLYLTFYKTDTSVKQTPELDSLKLKSETLYTKRELASLAAKIFDPIGLISPFTVRSKLLLQSLWTQGVGWDDELPEETSRKWVQWVQELSELEQLHIPRSYIDWPLSQHAKVELHAFGDASEVAYATSIYIRVVPKEGKASTSLVMSKTRVLEIVLFNHFLLGRRCIIVLLTVIVLVKVFWAMLY